MKSVKDPTIPFAYAKQREEVGNSYRNPLGAATSSATRDAATRVTNQSLAQDEAQANAASQFNADNQNFSRQATVAQFTNPQLVQTGGSTQTSGGFWSGLLTSAIGAGANLGAAGLS